MKNGLACKLLALLLAVVFVGCQAAPATQTDEDRTYQLTDTLAAEYAFEKEYPAIDAELTLPGDTLAGSVQGMAVKKAPAEVKAVWISFLELEPMLKNATESEFSSKCDTMFDNIKDYGLNTAIIQVRPYADAFYKSGYFPWSFLITGTEGKDPGFDPFSIMVKKARARGLRIEAWVNPYRVRPADRKDALSKNNYAKKWLDAKDDSVISYNGIISYNPASTKAQNLIINGVLELVNGYDIDGIHIDDYFYPTTDKAFDQKSYSAYTKGGGKLSLADWRRSNVETLLKRMYSAIKNANSKMLFGISPQSSVYNNYNAHYLDVKKIAANTGYCDYICPQIYFGYDNAAQPFKETLDTWNKMVTAKGVKLYVGLAAYKVGAVDSWAGAGKNEWVNNTDRLAKMTKASRNCNSYGGIALYRYDYMFNPPAAVKSPVKKEMANLKNVL